MAGKGYLKGTKFNEWFENELNEIEQKAMEEYADGASVPEIAIEFHLDERHLDRLIATMENLLHN